MICFGGGLLAAWLWKQDTGNISQHAPSPVQPCKAKKNMPCMRSNMHSRPRWPTLSWHPLRATSPYAVGKTNWRRVSSNSLGVACLYRIPLLRTRWFCSHPNWLTFGGSVALDWPFPSIPSRSLVMTRLGIGSTSWAWHQSLRAMVATCLLSWSTSRTCAGHCCGPLWG